LKKSAVLLKNWFEKSYLEDYVSQALGELLNGKLPGEVKPVRPLVETRAEDAVRELRDERT
jgi:hypothetical protein